jgi:hypothetical protein
MGILGASDSTNFDSRSSHQAKSYADKPRMYMRGSEPHNRYLVTETNRNPVENRRALLIAMAIFVALSVWAGRNSDGFLEADACTHFQYARWCGQDPNYLVNVWGRPFCTAIYALPAILADRAGTKITSLLIALATALLTWRIAKVQQYRWPVLALIFLLAQPLVFLHSFSELTELPFAMLTAGAFLMYCRKRWWALAILAGLMPLARPEGFAFLFLAALALLLHRKPIWLIVLVIPLLAWNLAGWRLDPGNGPWWKWLPNHWPYAATSVYQSGSMFHFLLLLPIVTAPLLFPFFLMGVWKNLRPGFAVALRDHRLRCDALIALLPLAILAGHSWLYWRGQMASNGEIRYLLITAPFWALLAERGWEYVFALLNWSRPFLFAGAAALLPAIANFIYPVLPLHFDPNWQEARRIAAWCEHGDLHSQYPRVLAAHPGISYFLHICPTDTRYMLQWGRQNVLSDPAGTILVWDDVYSMYNADANLVISRQQIEQAGWKLFELDEDGYRHNWAIYHSAKPAPDIH